MTTAVAQATRPDVATPTTPAATKSRWRPNDASSPLRLYVTLLLALPSGLVFGPLGAAGSPASLLGLVFFAWWINARLAPGLGIARGRQPVRIAMYVLLLASLASYLAGTLRAITPEESSSSDRGLLSLAAWAGILLVTADGIRERRSLDRLLRYLSGAGMALAAVGLVQFFSGWNAATLISIPGLTYNEPLITGNDRGDFQRVQATAAHAIEFGLVIAMILPIALHYAWFATTKKEKRRRWAAVISMALVLPMTVSRSAMVALAAISIVLICTWTPRQRLLVLRTTPFLAIGLKLLVPGLLGTIRKLFLNVSSDPSTQGRTDDYAAVEYYVHQRPIFGRGVFTFIPESYRILDNAFLGWTIEAGFVGLLALLGLLFTGIFTALHARERGKHDPRTRDLGASLAASLLAGAINFGTFDALGFAMFSGLFFLLLGAAGALWRLAPQATEDSDLAGTGDHHYRRLTTNVSLSRTLIRVAGRSIFVVIAVALVWAPSARVHDYIATGTLLLGTSDGPRPDLNPYLYSPYVNIPSDVAQRLIMSSAAAERLREEGYTASYTVASGDGSLMPKTEHYKIDPVIHIQVIGKTAEETTRTRNAVQAEMISLFDGVQRNVGVPSYARLRLVPLLAETPSEPEFGKRSRALADAALIGFCIGSMVVFIVERRLFPSLRLPPRTDAPS